MAEPIRILMMGTPEFAVPVLQALLDARYTVVGVFTQPDKPVGRNRTLTPPPLKQAAEQLGLPVFQPAKLREPSVLDQIKALQPDLAITAAYGQLLPQDFLDLPRFGCLNVHASVLPRWRGAAPIHRALMAGDGETGVTIMQTVLALDAGPVLGVAKLPIEERDTFGTLHDKLSHTGAKLLIELLPAYLAGNLQPLPQPAQGVTYAGRILRQDEFLNFSQPVRAVYNQARALTPWPGASGYFQNLPIKVWPESMVEDVGPPPTEIPLGTMQGRSDGKVAVRCQDGWMFVLQVQPAGKRRMLAAEWLRGQKGNAVILDSANNSL